MLEVKAIPSEFKGADRGSEFLNEYSLPKGGYYVGDPCYIFSNEAEETWQELVNLGDTYGIFATVNGIPFVAYSTAYGDGFYFGEKSLYDKNFPVDAGLLGIVPESLVELLPNGLQNAENEIKAGTIHRVEFEHSINSWSDHFATFFLESKEDEFFGTIPTDI